MHRSITHTLAADHWHFTSTRAARIQRIQSDTQLTATPACVRAARAQLLTSDTLLTATPACVCAARSVCLRTVSAGHWRVWVLHEWVRCQGEARRIHGHGRGRRCESHPGRPNAVCADLHTHFETHIVCLAMRHHVLARTCRASARARFSTGQGVSMHALIC